MKTIDIKGKPYVTVNERLKYFREHYEGWSIKTEFVSIDNGVCVMKAVIEDEKGIVRAVGHAYEKEDSTFINKTSYIENCESSAWGRALGCLGIGIDTSIASAEEVSNAINNQGKTNTPKSGKKVTEAQVKRLFAIAKSKDITTKQVVDTVINDYKKNPSDLTVVEYNQVVARIEAK